MYGRKPAPESPLGYLQQLPADILLDRLETPYLAVDTDGRLIYANPACSALLGYEHGALADTLLDSIMVRRRQHDVTPFDFLRSSSGQVLALWRSDQSLVRVLVGKTVFLRNDDPIALAGLHDVTELLWELQRVPATGEGEVQ